jgi:cytochrome c-type biogenesis protein CcmH/NrfG
MRLHDYQAASESALAAKDGLLQYAQKTGGSIRRLMMAIDEVLASAYSEMGRKYWLDAERIFATILQENHSNVKALLGLSSIYLSQRRFDEASNLVDKILQLSPER